ncbi:hypothetical protein BJV77DRAFT_566984 [Russula vinacea]|nr:hypothetical protein BJV77DRAFT_566984 [Russula vinacea]
MKSLASRLSDSQFLLEMKGVHDEVLRPTICDIEVLSRSLLSSLIDRTADAMARAAAEMQQEIFRRTIQYEIESEEIEQRNEALKEFIRKLNAQLALRKDPVVYINGIATTPPARWGNSWGRNNRFHHSQEYQVMGRRETLKDYKLAFRVHLMNLSRDDIQNMQSDTKYIPGPIVNDRLSFSFHMPMAMNIVFCQILKNEKLLLILVDRERVFIYLEPLSAIDAAIRRSQPIKTFNRERLSQDVLFAYDEIKRTLAVCASKNCNFTYSFSTRPSKLYRRRGVSPTLPRGIAKQGSPFYKWLSSAGKRRWC